MERILIARTIPLVATPASSGVELRKEKTDAYDLRLEAPEAAIAIASVGAEIMRRFEREANEIIDTAKKNQFCGTPGDDRSPCRLDVSWRVTFESARVLSLSSNDFSEDGAHEYSWFDTVVWDKQASRDISLTDLFAENKRATALHDIAAYAERAFLRWRSKVDGSPEVVDGVEDYISADPQKLGHYALTYAKGEARANGIVLLWGAGENWARVVGEVRISIPAVVFSKYLLPEWRAQFR